MCAAKPTLLLAVFVGVTAISSLAAQDAQKNPNASPTVRELDAAVSRYYEKPFNIPRFLSDWERLGGPGREGTIGFLAGVFAKHPNEVRAISSAPLGKQAQIVVTHGLRLANKYDEAIRVATLWGWPQHQIAPIRSSLPLLQMKAESAASFDVFWGASFATEDASYVRPIFDYYAAAAGHRDIDVRDIVTIVMARHRPNKEAIEAIAKKYPRETTMRIVYAASALWSLESNARQHKFVAAALDRYTKEQPNSAAAKGLNELRSALAQR